MAALSTLPERLGFGSMVIPTIVCADHHEDDGGGTKVDVLAVMRITRKTHLPTTHMNASLKASVTDNDSKG